MSSAVNCTICGSFVSPYGGSCTRCGSENTYGGEGGGIFVLLFILIIPVSMFINASMENEGKANEKSRSIPVRSLASLKPGADMDRYRLEEARELYRESETERTTTVLADGEIVAKEMNLKEGTCDQQGKVTVCLQEGGAMTFSTPRTPR